jgi:hypothetical protein
MDVFPLARTQWHFFPVHHRLSSCSQQDKRHDGLISEDFYGKDGDRCPREAFTADHCTKVTAWLAMGDQIVLALDAYPLAP